MAFDWIKAKETLRESSAFASLEALAQTGAVSKGPGFLICADTQTKTAIIARA